MKLLTAGIPALLATVVLCATPAEALTIGAFDNGWYRNDGSHTSTNPNILVSDSTTSATNNFFAFDLSAVSGTVTYAALKIYGGNGNYLGADATENYEIFDFGGDIDDLISGAGGTAAFGDLGSGTSYGSLFMSTPGGFGAMPTLSFLLPTAALIGINAAISGSDGRFVIGGTSSSLTPNQSLWHSSSFASAAELEILVLPGSEHDTPHISAPGGLSALIAAAVPLALARRARRRRATADA